jgi:hypothetical protein
VALVVGLLILGLVLAIAAAFVVREAGRIAREPPPALFDTEDALAWVVEHVPDDVAATLTVDDVRRILELQLEFLEARSTAGNGHATGADQPVVFGDAETVSYILEQAGAAGETYLPEQIRGVLDTQLSYLRSIGAVGPPAPPRRPPTA